MLAMILFVLALFKFPVTLNSFKRFPSFTNFIFATVSYHKEAVSRTLCSLSASASRVAVTGADTASYNFEIVFLKNVFTVYFMFLRNFSIILRTERRSTP